MKRLIALTMCAVSLGAAAQLPDYVPTDGLVAWYPFNENSNDESGNEHHADLNFDAVLSHDRFGLPNASVFLDGQQDHVSTPAIFNSGLDRTISIWIDLLNADDVTNTIWNTDPHWIESIGWNTYFLDEPGISYCLGDATDWLSCANGGVPETYFDVAIDMSSWKHLVSVKEGVDWRFYIDGSLVHDSVVVINTINQTVPLVFGAISCCGSDGYGEEFTGSIDDIGIWNRAITEEEVLALFNAIGPIEGCTDAGACNYDAAANIDNGTCASCETLATACGEGTVWDSASQTCIVANPSDSNFDGCVQLNDLLDLLSAYGNCTAEESPWQCGDPLDYQGYDYETVQIGEQCWLAENLRNELYQNGDSIQANLSDEEWGNTDIGGVGATTVFGEPSFLCEEFSPDGDGCDEAWSLMAYGRLYNWYALNDARGLCPSGWHVPSDEEWTSLTDQFGGLSNAGDDLKSVSGWYNNGNGSNEFGFSALPGGLRNGGNGSFQYAGSKAFFWSATETIDREINYWSNSIERQTSKDLKKGMSIRCIKNAE